MQAAGPGSLLCCVAGAGLGVGRGRAARARAGRVRGRCGCVRKCEQQGVGVSREGCIALGARGKIKGTSRGGGREGATRRKHAHARPTRAREAAPRASPPPPPPPPSPAAAAAAAAASRAAAPRRGAQHRVRRLSPAERAAAGAGHGQRRLVERARAPEARGEARDAGRDVGRVGRGLARELGVAARQVRGVGARLGVQPDRRAAQHVAQHQPPQQRVAEHDGPRRARPARRRVVERAQQQRGPLAHDRVHRRLQVHQLLHAGVGVARGEAEAHERARQEQREQPARLGRVPQLKGPRGGGHQAERGARDLLALGGGCRRGGGVGARAPRGARPAPQAGRARAGHRRGAGARLQPRERRRVVGVDDEEEAAAREVHQVLRRQVRVRRVLGGGRVGAACRAAHGRRRGGSEAPPTPPPTRTHAHLRLGGPQVEPRLCAAAVRHGERAQRQPADVTHVVGARRVGLARARDLGGEVGRAAQAAAARELAAAA